ncbi:hypothetical protein FACS189425_03550 [Clostridia bacterium]|nr:hypothetical protein FACS189425_03550 [Clostridia bacterium]
MSLFDNLTFDDLSGVGLELAEIIGLEAVKKLVLAIGGTNVQIPTKSILCKKKRNRYILKDFNGYNTAHLALKWDLTERRIQEIIREELPEYSQTTLLEEST